MKTKKQYPQKDVAKTAYKIIYSSDVLILRRDIGYIKMKMLDLRYNFHKEVARFVATHKISDNERITIIEKRKNRRANKNYILIPISKLPIVFDYLEHKLDLIQVCDDHLRFYSGRNHWAKNEKDLKILAILKKHFHNKNK